MFITNTYNGFVPVAGDACDPDSYRDNCYAKIGNYGNEYAQC
jgi:hypothetical protein